MPQLRTPPDTWLIDRTDKEVVPLLVLDINGSPTTTYTVSCVPDGTHPVTFAAPTAAGAALGYLADGPTLGPGKYQIWVKMTGSPEVITKVGAVLYVW